MNGGARRRAPVWVWPVTVAFVVLTLLSHAAIGGAVLGLLSSPAVPERSGAPVVAAPEATTPTPVSPSPTPTSPSPTVREPTPAAPQGPLVLPASCVRRSSPKTAATIPEGNRFGTSMKDLGRGARLVRLYEVRKRELTPIDGVDGIRSCDRTLWRIITTVAPPEVLTFVNELLVFDADLGGPSSIAGEVVPGGGFASFRLALSLNGMRDPREIAFVVAHEIAHLVTLNDAEVVDTEDSDCSKVVILGDVCLRKDSLLRDYLRHTWAAKMSADWWRAVGSAPKARQVDAAEAFVAAHPGSFVTPYAGYSQAEDFAETFAVWCALDPRDPYRRDVTSSAHRGARAKVAWMQAEPQVKTDFGRRCVRLRTLKVM